MWKLKNIVATNICAFRQLDYNLDQGVTTLIFGDNRDNDSQRSNGSGKSALIECIALGILGAPLRKIKNDEIVNDNAEQCYISLLLVNDFTGDSFTIERIISRTGPSVIKCWSGEQQVIQPSVDGYNKYILEVIGLSRDEVLNNFILSKYRYQEFLSSSDREKKEIINYLSNGNLVDQSIALIDADLLPIEKDLSSADLDLAGLNGRIDMLLEQIQNEKESSNDKKLSIEDKLRSIDTSITGKRLVIEEREELIEAHNSAIEGLENRRIQIQQIEASKLSMEAALAATLETMEGICALSQWNGRLEERRTKIKEAEADLRKWDKMIGESTHKVGVASAEYLTAESQHRVFMDAYDEKKEHWDSELTENEKTAKELNNHRQQVVTRQRTISMRIEELNRKIAGSVACPACNHVFLASDKDYDVAEGKRMLAHARKEYENLAERMGGIDLEIEKNAQMRTYITNQISALEKSFGEQMTALQAAKRGKETAEYELQGLEFNRKRVADYIADRNGEMAVLRRKLFDEVEDSLDTEVRNRKKTIAILNEECNGARMSIETLEATAQELRNSDSGHIIESLEKSLAQYREQAVEVISRKQGLEEEVYRLYEQKDYFNQFKTYLANTKIEALSLVTNEFLSDIGSDIRIQFSGYTVLKSGKVREKISVSLIRDGVDCGSFGKFSAGEAARVNLATILAMQKLINANCEDGKGLDLLVLDEILEAVDEDGLSAMFSALNSLTLTCLVVSHGNIAESYPYQIKIVKENGVSRIEKR